MLDETTTDTTTIGPLATMTETGRTPDVMTTVDLAESAFVLLYACSSSFFSADSFLFTPQ
jgi:hypothetical protein